MTLVLEPGLSGRYFFNSLLNFFSSQNLYHNSLQIFIKTSVVSFSGVFVIDCSVGDVGFDTRDGVSLSFSFNVFIVFFHPIISWASSPITSNSTTVISSLIHKSSTKLITSVSKSDHNISSILFIRTLSFFLYILQT